MDEQKALEILFAHRSDPQAVRNHLLEFSQDVNPDVRKCFCLALVQFETLRNDEELQKRVLESLADENLDVRVAACETSLRLKLDITGYWVRIHKNETRDCISISRAWQLTYKPELTTEEERLHLESCGFCSQRLAFCQNEKDSP